MSSFFIDKMGIINVKSYGAVGDGTTDDTEAIQDTLDAAETAGGGIVYFPKGTYLVSTGLTVGNNITICGAGYSSIVKLDSGNTTKVFSNNDTSTGNSNITIRDLKIDGNKANRTGNLDYMIYFDNVDNVLIENIFFYNSRWDDIFLQSVNNYKINNIYSENCRMVSVGTYYLCSHGTISNCYVYNLVAAEAGLFGHSYRINGTDVVVENCIADGCGDAAFVVNFADSTWDTRAKRVTLNNCVAIDTRDFGFFVSYAEDVTISNCIARTTSDSGTSRASSAGGGFGYAEARNLTITNCIAHDCYYSGVLGGSDQAAGDDSTNIVISNCVFYNNNKAGTGHAGIFMYATQTNDNYILSNNICYDDQTTPTQEYGIRLGGGTNGTCIVEGNMCYGNALHGIYAGLQSSEYANINGNYCYNNGRDGTGDGINLLDPINFTISNNVCIDYQSTETQRYGIALTQSAQVLEGNIITSNRCYNNKRHGIFCEDIKKNVISNNITQNNSQETANTYSGIYLYGAEDCVVMGNISAGNKYGIEMIDGVSFDSTLTNVINNDVRQNGTAGVSIVDEKTLSNGNVVKYNKGYLTEFAGTGAIANGATATTVTHSLDVTPIAREIQITPTNNPSNDPGNIWVDTITATQFNVNCRNDPGVSTLTFSWKIAP
jgi:parallel beta-helix repeat protein